jgi:MoaA/NifB/PqqE/SkfB family radical SAM enzyme
MKIKRFNQINESDYQGVKLIILVDNNGNKITKDGYAKEGVGIFDYEANEYPAGIDENGNVHASQVLDNRVLRLDEEGYVPNIKMDQTYKPVYENNTEETCYTESEVLVLLENIASELLFEYVDYQDSESWAKSMGITHAKEFFDKNKK